MARYECDASSENVLGYVPTYSEQTMSQSDRPRVRALFASVNHRTTPDVVFVRIRRRGFGSDV
jgi:hypothetical protein